MDGWMEGESCKLTAPFIMSPEENAASTVIHLFLSTWLMVN